MKPFNEYRTPRQMALDFLKEGFEISYFNLRKLDDPWDSVLEFDKGLNNFSCAIDEWGCFNNNGGREYLKFWPHLIWYTLKRSNPKFVRCSTTEKTKELNDALFDNGFIPTGSVKSNPGRYQVYMWEYWGDK